MWTLDWVDGTGTRRRQALSTDKRVAEQMRIQLVAERDLQLGGLDLSLRELAGRHLEDLATRATETHVQNIRGILDRAVAALPGMASELRPYDLVRYRGTLVEAGVANRTANHHVSRLTTLLRWGAKMGLISHSPVGEIDKLPEREKDKRYRRRAMSEQEIQRFLAALAQDDREAPVAGRHVNRPRVPQLPFFAALIATGARYGELRQLRWCDVDLFGRTVLIRADTAKSGKERVIPIAEDTAASLTALRAVHCKLFGSVPTTGLVFLSPNGGPWCRPSNNVNRILRRVLDRAGIPRLDDRGRKLDLHALRHTCASRLARAKVGLVQAQHLLGHADPKLTARVYSHIELEDLRAAVQPLPRMKDVG